MTEGQLRLQGSPLSAILNKYKENEVNNESEGETNELRSNCEGSDCQAAPHK